MGNTKAGKSQKTIAEAKAKTSGDFDAGAFVGKAERAMSALGKFSKDVAHGEMIPGLHIAALKGAIGEMKGATGVEADVLRAEAERIVAQMEAVQTALEQVADAERGGDVATAFSAVEQFKIALPTGGEQPSAASASAEGAAPAAAAGETQVEQTGGGVDFDNKDFALAVLRMAQGGRVTLKRLQELPGVSRKTAPEVMDWLEAQGVVGARPDRRGQARTVDTDAAALKIANLQAPQRPPEPKGGDKPRKIRGRERRETGSKGDTVAFSADGVVITRPDGGTFEMKPGQRVSYLMGDIKKGGGTRTNVEVVAVDAENKRIQIRYANGRRKTPWIYEKGLSVRQFQEPVAGDTRREGHEAKEPMVAHTGEVIYVDDRERDEKLGFRELVAVSTVEIPDVGAYVLLTDGNEVYPFDATDRRLTKDVPPDGVPISTEVNIPNHEGTKGLPVKDKKDQQLRRGDIIKLEKDGEPPQFIRVQKIDRNGPFVAGLPVDEGGSLVEGRAKKAYTRKDIADGMTMEIIFSPDSSSRNENLQQTVGLLSNTGNTEDTIRYRSREHGWINRAFEIGQQVYFRPSKRMQDEGNKLYRAVSVQDIVELPDGIDNRGDVQKSFQIIVSDGVFIEAYDPDKLVHELPDDDDIVVEYELPRRGRDRDIMRNFGVQFAAGRYLTLKSGMRCVVSRTNPKGPEIMLRAVDEEGNVESPDAEEIKLSLDDFREQFGHIGIRGYGETIETDAAFSLFEHRGRQLQMDEKILYTPDGSDDEVELVLIGFSHRDGEPLLDFQGPPESGDEGHQIFSFTVEQWKDYVDATMPAQRRPKTGEPKQQAARSGPDTPPVVTEQARAFLESLGLEPADTVAVTQDIDYQKRDKTGSAIAAKAKTGDRFTVIGRMFDTHVVVRDSDGDEFPIPLGQFSKVEGALQQQRPDAGGDPAPAVEVPKPGTRERKRGIDTILAREFRGKHEMLAISNTDGSITEVPAITDDATGEKMTLGKYIAVLRSRGLLETSIPNDMKDWGVSVDEVADRVFGAAMRMWSSLDDKRNKVSRSIAYVYQGMDAVPSVPDPTPAAAAPTPTPRAGDPTPTAAAATPDTRSPEQITAEFLGRFGLSVDDPIAFTREADYVNPSTGNIDGTASAGDEAKVLGHVDETYLLIELNGAQVLIDPQVVEKKTGDPAPVENPEKGSEQRNNAIDAWLVQRFENRKKDIDVPADDGSVRTLPGIDIAGIKVTLGTVLASMAGRFDNLRDVPPEFRAWGVDMEEITERLRVVASEKLWPGQSAEVAESIDTSFSIVPEPPPLPTDGDPAPAAGDPAAASAQVPPSPPSASEQSPPAIPSQEQGGAAQRDTESGDPAQEQREDAPPPEVKIIDIPERVWVALLGDLALDNMAAARKGLLQGNRTTAEHLFKTMFSHGGIDADVLTAHLEPFGYTPESFVDAWQERFYQPIFRLLEAWVSQEQIRDAERTISFGDRFATDATGRIKQAFYGGAPAVAGAAVLGLAGRAIEATKDFAGAAAGAGAGIGRWFSKFGDALRRKQQEIQEDIQTKRQAQLSRRMEEQRGAMVEYFGRSDHMDMRFAAILSQGLRDISAHEVDTGGRQANEELLYAHLMERVRDQEPSREAQLDVVVAQMTADLYRQDRQEMIEKILERNPKIIRVLEKVLNTSRGDFEWMLTAEDRRKLHASENDSSNKKVALFAAMVTTGAAAGYALQNIPGLRSALGALAGGYLGLRYGHEKDKQAREEAMQRDLEHAVGEAESAIRYMAEGSVVGTDQYRGNDMDHLHKLAAKLRTPLSLGLLDERVGLRARALNVLRRIEAFEFEDHLRDERVDDVLSALEEQTDTLKREQEQLTSDLNKDIGVGKKIAWGTVGVLVGGSLGYAASKYAEHRIEAAKEAAAQHAAATAAAEAAPAPPAPPEPVTPEPRPPITIVEAPGEMEMLSVADFAASRGLAQGEVEYLNALTAKFPELGNEESLERLIDAAKGNYVTGEKSQFGAAFKGRVDTMLELAREADMVKFEEILKEGGAERAAQYLALRDFNASALRHLGTGDSHAEYVAFARAYENQVIGQAEPNADLMRRLGRALQADENRDMYKVGDVQRLSVRAKGGAIRIFGMNEVGRLQASGELLAADGQLVHGDNERLFLKADAPPPAPQASARMDLPRAGGSVAFTYDEAGNVNGWNFVSRGDTGGMNPKDADAIFLKQGSYQVPVSNLKGGTGELMRRLQVLGHLHDTHETLLRGGMPANSQQVAFVEANIAHGMDRLARDLGVSKDDLFKPAVAATYDVERFAVEHPADFADRQAFASYLAEHKDVRGQSVTKALFEQPNVNGPRALEGFAMQYMKAHPDINVTDIAEQQKFIEAWRVEAIRIINTPAISLEPIPTAPELPVGFKMATAAEPFVLGKPAGVTVPLSVWDTGSGKPYTFGLPQEWHPQVTAGGAKVEINLGGDRVAGVLAPYTDPTTREKLTVFKVDAGGGTEEIYRLRDIRKDPFASPINAESAPAAASAQPLETAPPAASAAEATASKQVVVDTQGTKKPVISLWSQRQGKAFAYELPKTLAPRQLANGEIEMRIAGDTVKGKMTWENGKAVFEADGGDITEQYDLEQLGDNPNMAPKAVPKPVARGERAPLDA